MAPPSPEIIRVPCEVRGAGSFASGIAFGASSILMNASPKKGHVEFGDESLTIMAKDNLDFNVKLYKANFSDLSRLTIQKDNSQGYNVTRKIETALLSGFAGGIVGSILFIFVFNSIYWLWKPSFVVVFFVVWIGIAVAILFSAWKKPNPFLIVAFISKAGRDFAVRIGVEQLEEVRKVCGQKNLLIESPGDLSGR